jgi:hypothetical protein
MIGQKVTNVHRHACSACSESYNKRLLGRHGSDLTTRDFLRVVTFWHQTCRVANHGTEQIKKACPTVDLTGNTQNHCDVFSEVLPGCTAVESGIGETQGFRTRLESPFSLFRIILERQCIRTHKRNTEACSHNHC